MAFVALLGEAIIGVGRYDRLGSGTEAEVAFAVADDHQGGASQPFCSSILPPTPRTTGSRSSLPTHSLRTGRCSTCSDPQVSAAKVSRSTMGSFILLSTLSRPARH